MPDQDFAAGASAARNKVARYLREHGLEVEPSNYGCPPTDEDFLRTILAAVQEGGQRPGSGLAIVIFTWWQSQYQVPVATSVLNYLREHPERRHDLFSATSLGGSNTFFLAANEAGEIVVHRKKHWRSDVEEFETTILYIR